MRFCSRWRLAGTIWHSQTVIMLQPARRRALRVRRSRRALHSSFATQYRRLAVGIRHPPQVCMCQKQNLASIVLRGRQKG